MARLITGNDRVFVDRAIRRVDNPATVSLDNRADLGHVALTYEDPCQLLARVLFPGNCLVQGVPGSGKTAILLCALEACRISREGKSKLPTCRCEECLNNFKENPNHAQDVQDYFDGRRFAGVYINLRECFDLRTPGSTIEHNAAIFLRTMVDQLCAEIKPEGLGKKAEVALQRLHAFVESGASIHGTESTVERENETQQQTKGGLLGATDKASVSYEESSASRKRNKEQGETRNAWPASTLINLIRDVKNAAGIDVVLYLLDDFSKLDSARQRATAEVVNALLENKEGIYFKIAAVPGQFELGEDLPIADLKVVNLDTDELLACHSSMEDGLAEIEEHTQNIILRNLPGSTGLTIGSLFKRPEEAVRKVARAAMGVPGLIGRHLTAAWDIASREPGSVTQITDDDVDYAIKRIAREILDRFDKQIGKESPPGKLWNELLQAAKQERTRVPSEAASHFWVARAQEDLLNVLSNYHLIHRIARARASKKDITMSLYCFSYGLCQEFGLGFATSLQQVPQDRFNYEHLLKVHA